MQNRLYVRDFGNETDLECLFSNVGTVQSTKLGELVVNGVRRRVAYIEMATADEMADCIARFHGMKTDGYTLTVTEDKPHVAPPPRPRKSSKKRPTRA